MWLLFNLIMSLILKNLIFHKNTQLLRVESLLDSVWNSDVDLIILPETFIIDWIWESRIEVAPVVQRMRSWLKDHPRYSNPNWCLYR